MSLFELETRAQAAFRKSRGRCPSDIVRALYLASKLLGHAREFETEGNLEGAFPSLQGACEHLSKVTDTREDISIWLELYPLESDMLDMANDIYARGVAEFKAQAQGV